MHIDWWTLALQTINVIVLVWLLARFFFKPISKIIADRQAVAQKAIDDVDAARQTVARAHQEADDMRARIATEREALVAEAKKTAKAEQDTLLAQANDQIAGLRKKTETDLAREKLAAQDALITRASDLSVTIATRLVTRISPGVAMDAFVEGLADEIRQLPAHELQGFNAARENGERVQVITAAPMTEAQRQRLEKSLKSLFDGPMPLSFDTDPALIAGIELRCRGAIIGNSWKHDIETIAAELRREGARPRWPPNRDS